MPRSTDILSRIYRNLRRHGISLNDLLDQEVFDEMMLGQDRIISEIFPDKIITIAFVEGLDTYPLTTDEEDITRTNIASVKVVKLPAGWASNSGLTDFNNQAMFSKGFSVIPNDLFVETVNANPDLEGRPKIATIINNELKVYPAPTEEEEDEQIQLYAYISSSAGIINKENEPELRNDFDKALEKYATSQILGGDEGDKYLAEFQNEVKRLSPIQNRKHHNLTRQPISGFLG